MTGFEILGAVLVIGMIAGLFGGSSDTATKTEACLVCVTTETSLEKDVDLVTEPDLNEHVEPPPKPAFPNP